ncbi:hypothetical protein LXL04_030181 [Taraxacum kok-saghyz]
MIAPSPSTITAAGTREEYSEESRSSFCKTKRCQCEAVECFCSASCGCYPKKCSNRNSSDDSSRVPAAVMVEGDGAMILVAVLAEKTNKGEGSKRKPHRE